METPSAPGRKDDGGKLRWSLLPWRELEAVVAVLEYGARKYAPGNWRHVTNGYERYREAIGRHHAAIMKGEHLDPESGLPHLAHLACNCLFALYFITPEEVTTEEMADHDYKVLVGSEGVVHRERRWP